MPIKIKVVRSRAQKISIRQTRPSWQIYIEY